MTCRGREEGCPGHNWARAAELIALMRVLVEWAEANDAFPSFPGDGVLEFFCADGKTRLQRLGENLYVEVSSDTPPETIYVLLGEGFLVQMIGTREFEDGDLTFSLDLVEGYEQARTWLLAHTAGPASDRPVFH